MSLFTFSRVGISPNDRTHQLKVLDRSNLGNARLQGLPEDVLGGDSTGVLFDWLVAIFYIPYVGVQANGQRSCTYLPVIRFCAKCHGPCCPSIMILVFGLVARPFYGAYALH